MSKGTEVLNGTVLEDFLGTEGVAELRTKMIDMIVEEVRDQLRDSSSYIISPEDIATELFNDVVEEIKEEVICEYKEKVNNAVMSKLGALGI